MTLWCREWRQQTLCRHGGAIVVWVDSRSGWKAGLVGKNEMPSVNPSQLSGGQRQRLVIGRAIVRDPKVFLFGEPPSNFDAALRVSMRIEIARLHRELGLGFLAEDLRWFTPDGERLRWLKRFWL